MIKIYYNISSPSNKLYVYLVLGLTKSEGFFSIGFYKSNKAKYKISVYLIFKR